MVYLLTIALGIVAGAAGSWMVFKKNSELKYPVVGTIHITKRKDNSEKWFIEFDKLSDEITASKMVIFDIDVNSREKQGL